MNLSVKNVPEDVAARLRARAAHSHHSLQGELMAIVCAAAAGEPLGLSTAAHSSTTDVRNDLRAASTTQGWKTVEQLLADRPSRGGTPRAHDASLPLAVDVVRANRNGH